MEKQHPFFSIVIPTFNRARLLSRAIKSVLEQSFNNWELIVIDDGSTDNNLSVINALEDNRIKYYYQENKERSVARNIGVEKTSGSYVLFLDDDDYFLSNHLSVFHSYLNAHNFPLTILRSGYYIEEKNKRTKQQNYSEKKHKNPVNFAAFNMCGVWSLCIPRIFLDEDKFPESFPHWQDTHLILRLLAKHPFIQLNCWTYIYVHHLQMGSLKHFDGEGYLSRVELNVNAIRDLFLNYRELVSPFLPENTVSNLVNEKYMGHAIKLLGMGNLKASKIVYKKSRFQTKYWKLHVKYWLTYMRQIFVGQIERMNL